MIGGGQGGRFALLDQIPLGVCVLSSDLEVRFWNACLESWTDIARLEVLGTDLARRFPHLREPRYLLRLQTIFEGGPPAVFSSQLHRNLIPAPLPTGELRIQHTVVTAIERHTRFEDAGESAGRTFDALVSIQDVTDLTRSLDARKRFEEERRRMEAQVQHAQKLESLGVLAGGIAHDFNNLLVGILGNADLVTSQLAADHPSRAELEAVIKSARRAADLAQQMLAYSGKATFKTAALDLSESVGDALELIQAGISKKARLECRLVPGLPAVEADPTQVRQVVMNLLTNASDALGDSPGTIGLETGAVECGADELARSYLGAELPSGLYVYVEVSDTGQGMDDATLARIFDPFFTTKFAGRGLGLAAVLGIVRGHRGTLMIESRPGVGSTFRVLFPSCNKTPEPGISRSKEVDDAGSAPWSSKATVLVVDDEEIVRNVAVKALERAGLRALTAADGEEAVGVARDRGGEIGVVLLDMTMPQLSGQETYERLRRILPDVPVVMSSGYTEPEAIGPLCRPEQVCFLQKPYAPPDLVEKIREVLQGSSRMDPPERT